MDIRSKSANDTARLVLRDPSGDVLRDDNGEVAVVVYGPASKRHANAMAARSNRAIDMMKRRGKTEQTAAQKIAENAEFLADCTAEFENLQYDNLTGRDLAIAVYSDQSLGFIADQVAEFIGDWVNFTKTSTTN